ncbi:COG3152 Predicted membrane protein [Candidatus Nanopelagicaceae bacterium]
MHPDFRKDHIMGNAISACFSKYATFSGRATRSEYWYFYLFYIIVYIVGSVVAGIVGASAVLYLFILPLWLPNLAVGIRRMHDVGRSGWFILIPIYNLVLLCSSSTGDNQYGARA